MKSIGSTLLKVAAIVVCLGISLSACYVRDGGPYGHPVYAHGDDHREYHWSHR